jgi:hypothetical protein
MDTTPRKRSLGERWIDARPTKTAMFWSWVLVVVLTLIVGFEWGGWVTGKTAKSMAEAASNDAVIARLAPLCVVKATQPGLRDQAGLGHAAHRARSGSAGGAAVRQSPGREVSDGVRPCTPKMSECKT